VTGWRFALSGRWLGYLAVAVVFAIVCGFLAHWQWARHEEKMAVAEQLDRNYDAEPVPLADLVPDTDALAPGVEWRPVTVTGRYLVDETLLVRNRPFNGQPGFEVLVPFELAGGEVFLVDRGWVPTGNAQDSPDEVPAPPTGDVTVTARLKPGEPRVGDRTDIAGTNQIATIQLDDVAERLDEPLVTGAYGLLAAESPAPDTRPAPSVEPEIDTGLNLSYFVQWLMFAVGAFAFLFYVVRQEHRNRTAEPDELEEREAERQRRRAARGSSDDEAEDALLDAAGR